MNALPLFYFPSSCIWVDDDSLFLEAIKVGLGQTMTIVPFQQPEKAIEFVHQYQSPLAKYHFIKSNQSDETHGMLDSAPMNFDVTTIAKLAEDPDRHHEISIVGIDYNMPIMDGFELATHLKELPAAKIMLTGNTQERKVIEGFNSGLINRFVEKAAVDMLSTLSSYIHELSLDYFQTLSAPLTKYLETDTLLPQTDPVFIEFFTQFCERHAIVEYYLLDKRGSLLCINKDHEKSVLVIQNKTSLQEWLATYQEDSGLDEEQLELIREGQQIPFFGIGKEAWQILPEQWQQHLYPAELLPGRENYYWHHLN